MVDVLDSWGTQQYLTTLRRLFPSAEAPNSACGQSFTTPAGSYILDSADFKMLKVGSPGFVTAQLYAHSGTYGVSSLPTGPVLAESDAVDGTTLQTTVAIQTFTFSGDQRILLSPNTYYCIAVVCKSGTFNDSNYVRVGHSSPGHSGIYMRYASGAWSNLDYDTYFTVYGEVGAGVTVKKGGGVVNSMITMLNNKMLYSACNRYPKLLSNQVI